MPPSKDLSLKGLVPSVSQWKVSMSLGGYPLVILFLLFLAMVNATIHSHHRLKAMDPTDHGLEPPNL